MGLFCDSLLISRRSREEPRRLNDHRRRWPPPRVYWRLLKETHRRGFVIGPDTCREGLCGATPGSVRDKFDGRSVSSSASISVKVQQCPLANLISLCVCRSICYKRGRLDGAVVRWHRCRRQKRCSLFYTAVMQLGRRPRFSERRFGHSGDVSFHEGGRRGPQRMSVCVCFRSYESRRSGCPRHSDSSGSSLTSAVSSGHELGSPSVLS